MGTVRLYKFYSEQWGVDSLRKRRLKISTLDDLNDPFEFRSFKISNPTIRKSWESFRKKLFFNKGIICFCRDWSNPVIWSHYAENHRGVALGFDVPERNVMHVKYRKHRLRIPEILKLPSSKLMDVMTNALSIKFVHWQYENEVRVFVSADEKCAGTGLFFKEFNSELVLKEIIIGPNSRIKSEDIRAIAGCEDSEIVTSRLAFSSYRVVKQRSPKLQK